MRLVHLGLAHLDPTVGALRSNLERAVRVAAEMAEAGVTVGAFSEQVLSGYPCEDLVQWSGYVETQWQHLHAFAERTGALAHPTVFVLGLTVEEGGHLYNAAAVVAGGRVLGIVPKEKLPTYGVFYEARTFSRGLPGLVTELRGLDGKVVPCGDLIFDLPFGTLAVEVCEDLWTPDGPLKRRAYAGADLVVNLSASPWRAGVVATRRELISTRAADNQVTLVYVNQVGGQDALVFDGGGFVNQNGAMVAEAPRWVEGWTSAVVDLERTAHLREAGTTWRRDCEDHLAEGSPVTLVDGVSPEAAEAWSRSQGRLLAERPPETHRLRSTFLPPVAPPTASPRAAYFDDLVEAMKTGLGGYFDKTGAFERLGISLSGGKDSTLTLVVAWLWARERFADLPEADRAGALRDFVHAFSMPSRFNSDATQDASRILCEELGVLFREVPIQDAFERELEACSALLGEGAEPDALTRQNVQARIRGMRMWNWANSARGLWLQTGNMSERAVGYTTVGGDLMGGYSLIGNLPKTVVTELLRHLHERHGWDGVARVLAQKASAELAEDQEDERDLMPFPVLDACFSLFAGEKMMPVDLYRALRALWTDAELRAMRDDYAPGMLKEWVKRFVRLFVASIFKWVQAPQTVHVGTLDLDRERALQLPVVQSREWLDLDAIDGEPD